LPKLRRLFGRAELERDEINILRGILDAVERRIAAPDVKANGK
jgi:tRNA/rRNA methyltransferase